MATGAQTLKKFITQTENAYNNVFKAFSQIAVHENTVTKSPYPGQMAFVAKQSAAPHINSVEVEGALRISKLPYKRKLDPGTSKHANGLEVLLDSRDIYKFADGKPDLETAYLYHSYVRVAYFRPTGRVWSPLLCLRYDYAEPSHSHPIFHVQLENGEPPAHVRAFFPEVPALDKVLQVHENIRVPTTNMVGATALLSLAADHLPLKRFPQMLKAVRDQKLFGDVWRCDYSRLDDGHAPGPMLSSCLYCST